MKRAVCTALLAIVLAGSSFAYWDCEWDEKIADPYSAEALDRALREETSCVRLVALSAMRLYQLTLSGKTGSKCCFYPSCSRYGFFAVKKFGTLKGSLMATERVMRCNPFAYGYDIDGDSGLFYNPPEQDDMYGFVFDWLNF